MQHIILNLHDGNWLIDFNTGLFLPVTKKMIKEVENYYQTSSSNYLPNELIMLWHQNGQITSMPLPVSERLLRYRWSLQCLHENILIDKFIELFKSLKGKLLCLGIDGGALEKTVAESWTGEVYFIDYEEGCGELPFDENSLDCVFVANLLCILSNPQALIEEITRICKNGGMMVLYDIDAFNIHYPDIPSEMEFLNNKVNEIVPSWNLNRTIGRKLGHMLAGQDLQKIKVTPVIFEKYHHNLPEISLAMIAIQLQEYYLIKEELLLQGFGEEKFNNALLTVVDYLVKHPLYTGTGILAMGTKDVYGL